MIRKVVLEKNFQEYNFSKYNYYAFNKNHDDLCMILIDMSMSNSTYQYYSYPERTIGEFDNIHDFLEDYEYIIYEIPKNIKITSHSDFLYYIKEHFKYELITIDNCSSECTFVLKDKCNRKYILIQNNHCKYTSDLLLFDIKNNKIVEKFERCKYFDFKAILKELLDKYDNMYQLDKFDEIVNI